MVDDDLSDTKNLMMLYFTCENEDSASHISTTLVREGLIATAHMTTGMRSIYERDGVLQLDNEIAVQMITKIGNAQAVTDRINEMYSYGDPRVIWQPILGGFKPYLQWVKGQITQG